LTRTRTLFLLVALGLVTLGRLALPGAAGATMLTSGPQPVAGAKLSSFQDDVDYQSSAGFVWADKRHGGWDIFRKKFNGVDWIEEWICTAAGDQTHPQAAESFIVWQDHRNGNWDIYGWSVDGHTEFPICTAAGDQTLPRIDGDHVVWQDRRSGNWNVWEATLSAPAGPVASGPTQVTSGGAAETAPDVSGDHIVFEVAADGDLDIYGADFADPAAPTVAICTNSKRQDQPVVDGDTVVWRDFRSLGGSGTDLYGHSYSGGTNVAIVTAAGDQESPSVSGDIIVFADYRRAFLSNSATQGPDIGFYDLTLSQDGVVCVYKGAQNKPVISGLTVTWTDWRTMSASTRSDIWTADLDPWTANLTRTGGYRRWVKDALVDLDLDATSKYGTVTQMSVTNVGTTDAVGPQPFAMNLLNWNLNAVLADTSDGQRTVQARFFDDSGGPFAASPPMSMTVMLDTTAPKARVPYAARARHGADVTLRYRVNDNLAPRATATMRIRTLGGTTVKTLPLGTVATGKLLGKTFHCTLASGSYRFWVTAKDLAGNLGGPSPMQTLEVTK